jgi:hypothetical protein
VKDLYELFDNEAIDDSMIQIWEKWIDDNSAIQILRKMNRWWLCDSNIEKNESTIINLYFKFYPQFRL